MTRFEIYLLLINIVSFLLYPLLMRLRPQAAKQAPGILPAVFSLAGGSVGTLAAILLFDRKAAKANMMSRVFIACIFVIQAVILLMMKGHHADTLIFAVWRIFSGRKLLLIYFVLINLIAFAAFGIDKAKAVRHRSRIRIVTLLGLAFVGGSVGSLAGMFFFHHKTKQNYFAKGVPLIIIMQLVVAFYLVNAGW